MTKFIVNGKQGYKTYHDWKAFWGMKGAPSTPPVPPTPTGLQVPMWFENTDNVSRTLSINAHPNMPVFNVEYSFDMINWTSVTITGDWSHHVPVVSVPTGTKVYIRCGTCQAYGSTQLVYKYLQFGNDTFTKVGGNIMSLVWGNQFNGQDYFPQGYDYWRGFSNGIFMNMGSLNYADQLLLPAMILPYYAYMYMFKGCSQLYYAPELPATTLTSQCYYGLFQGCSNLRYIKCLAVNDVDGYGDFRTYCEDWVDGVSSWGAFIASDNYTGGWYWGKDGVPENWTAETESGNYFEPAQGGGSGSQIYQSNGLTVYEMGSEQGGYQFQANGSSMEVPDFYGNDGCFAMMKISADQGSWGGAYMTPYLGNGVTAYISYEVMDDGTCPFSYSDGDEYDYAYSLTSSDDGNQISPGIDSGNCRWVKFVKNQGTYEYNTPIMSMDF